MTKFIVVGYHYEDGLRVVAITAPTPLAAAEKAQFRGKTMVFNEADAAVFRLKYEVES